ncbi:MAG: VIT1/CCC1 transporter family protein [Bacteroidaceae bacterium]|nr:VIT1/CCC1 transporter family protein [Bacteroidaceae bacterium]
MSTISEKSMEIIARMQQGELDEHYIYSNIAKSIRKKDPTNAATLQRIADEELKHYQIWRTYTHKTKTPRQLRVFWYTLLAKVLGFTFAVKLMERGESGAQDEYAQLAEEISESVTIRQQEEEHEQALLCMLDEERLQYVGSMVLGMNDALVELTGSLAGFTFALQNSKLVALSGLIVGISATFSMAASEFLSAKSEGRNDAFKSCCYTGVAYLVTVALLILPYMLIPNHLVALGIMLAIVLAEIAAFSYYIAVAKDEKFGKNFGTMACISCGVAALSFLVGIGAKAFLGLDV